MNLEVKEFIEKHINLIENDDWKQIYKLWNDSGVPEYTGKFTLVMQESGIDTLKGLDYIPMDYLGNTNITTFEVPQGIKGIYGYAFFACRDLQEFIIPNSVEYIGDVVFGKCPLLKEITYLGTKNEWRAISKGKLWKSSMYV